MWYLLGMTVEIIYMYPETFSQLTGAIPTGYDNGDNIYTQRPLAQLPVQYPLGVTVEIIYPETFSPLTGMVPAGYDGGDIYIPRDL